MRRSISTSLLAILLVVVSWATVAAKEVVVDTSAYSAKCGVQVTQDGRRLLIAWQMGGGQPGRLVLDLRPGGPLFESVSVGKQEVLRGLEPVTLLTVGARHKPPGGPPWLSEWSSFFDKPARRPHQTHRARFDLRRVKVQSQGRRVSITLGDVSAGPFAGDLVLTLYADSPLLHVETVVTTKEEHRAILYDTGLAGVAPGWRHLAWTDTEGRRQRVEINPQATDQPLAVCYRTLIAEAEHGALACFPPPHQYCFPRDWTDNLKFAWYGRDHHGQAHPFGFGIRQVADGGRAFEPWFNAPPSVAHRLGVFYLLSGGNAEAALREALRYTHGDRFPALPGHITYTHHYHMAVAVNAMKRQKQTTPDFVPVFKDMGIQVLHLADFHGDGHPRDPGPLRFPELEMLFRECERLSDRDFLLLPGEEINDYLGIKKKGQHPGHWMSFFPRPIYWTQVRGRDQPLVENHPRYGKVYHVGSRQDMMDLLRREKGLAWTAHPRIKASNWTPDVFRHEEFYLADFWVGAAWKNMPTDLSRPRLGERALGVLDDMANWGQHKYLIGEVDVFQVDHTHELYGHMNVNYVRLDRLPRYEQGWQPLLDALKRGRFFVSTGEVLLRHFTVGGQASGDTLRLKPEDRPEVCVTVDWTFPLRFAEVISGDGHKVYREHIDLSDTGPLSQRTLKLRPELRGRKWVRFEVWDVAANGAFTQPVWLQRE
jgi:hypothetical protein